MIPLGGDDRFDGVHSVGTMNVEQRPGEEGASGQVAMVHAKATTDKEGVAFDLSVHDVRGESDVLGEDVGVIAGGNGDTDLEFPRQVKLTVDGVVTFGGLGDGAHGRIDLGVLDPLRVDFFAVEPDVRISGGAPEEALGDFFGEAWGVLVGGVFNGASRAHGVADDVSAGAHGGETTVADIVDDFFESAFEHAMQLNALTIGEAHVAHGFFTEVIVDEPLLRGDASTGHFRADHEAPGFFLFGFDEGRALVAIILLIGAVVLEQNVHVLRDVRSAGVSKKFS